MEWKCKSLKQRHAAKIEWHKWFAWFPVRCGSSRYESTVIRWLEVVERKHDGTDIYYGMAFVYRKLELSRYRNTEAGRALGQRRKV